MNDQQRLRCDTGLWISLFTVVVDSQFGQRWQKTNEIYSTVVITIPNSCLRDIVTTPSHPGPHAFDMKLRTIEADICDTDFDTGG